MNGAGLRRLKAADLAERRAAEKLDAARDRLAAAIVEANEAGLSVRDIAEQTGRAKSHIGRVLARG